MPRRAPVTFKRFTGRTLLKPFVPARLLKASGMKFLKDRHRRQGHASSPGLLAACGTGLASGSLYEVANVSVDTTAKDPVVARALVLAKAGQKALRVVLKRLVPGSAQAMLPAITGCRGHDQQPLGAQRAELDHYLATFDVSFNEIAVKEFLDRRGVPFSEARAAQISILPLVLDRAGLKSKGAEGWRQAWEGLDLSHSIAPTNILRPRQPRRRDGVSSSRGSSIGRRFALESGRVAGVQAMEVIRCRNAPLRSLRFRQPLRSPSGGAQPERLCARGSKWHFRAKEPLGWRPRDA